MHLNVHIYILQFFDITFENPFKLIEALMFSEISILSEKLVTAYVDDFVFYFCISVEFQCHAKAYLVDESNKAYTCLLCIKIIFLVIYPSLITQLDRIRKRDQSTNNI